MTKISLVLTGTVLAAWPNNGNAQDATLIEKTVSECIKTVHSFKGDPMYEAFFLRFDAYYNAAKGTVENNAHTVGDQAALFQFNKCMAARGIPLGTKPN